MNKNSKLKSTIQKLLKGSFGFTLISIIIGFIIGAIILALVGFNPIEAYGIIFKGAFSRGKYIGWVIIRATPLIMTGLSVAFAFRTGLFNIGAEGQFIVGALTATAAGYFLHLPPIIHPIVVFLLAIMAAGIWGGIAGFLKSRFGVHEVIATIMLNWIAFYSSNFFIGLSGFKRANSEASEKILSTAEVTIFGQWKKSDAGKEFLNNIPFIKDLFDAPINWGIFVAILLALGFWYILNKTTLGYELRAVGFNPHAAEYGGINVKKSMVISMTIAGVFAGAAGALHVMGLTSSVTILSAIEGYGFNGIAVALIGGNTAIGSVLSGLLFGFLQYGGPKIQPALQAPSEVIDIMIGTIVFFIAIPNFIRLFYIRKRNRGEKHVE